MPSLVFFAANDEVHGNELWVTDGTPAGTRLVRDINTDNDILEVFRGSNPQDLEDLGDGRVVFRARDSLFGGREELWVSDGTSHGTGIVRNIGGSIDSKPGSMEQISPGLVVFHADDGVNGRELWITDGTFEGTRLLKDIFSGAASSLNETPNSVPRQDEDDFEQLFPGRVIFSADDGIHGRELWVTDGTPGGTHIVADIRPGTASSLPDFAQFYPLANGRAVFAADNGTNGVELWVTDGTASGTFILRDIVPGAGSISPGGFKLQPDGQMAFSSGLTFGLPYVTDGTRAGTVTEQESPLTSEPTPSPPTWEAGAGGWAMEGVESSVMQLPDGRALFSGTLIVLNDEGDLQQFSSSQLWVSDGSQGGTKLVYDLDDDSAPNVLSSFHRLPDGRYFFSGGYDYIHEALWVTDGTEAGTYEFAPQIQNILSDSHFFPNGLMTFVGRDQSDNEDLYVTDGTVGGTRVIGAGIDSYSLVTDLGFRGWLISNYIDTFEVGPGVYQRQYDLWVTDATQSGTKKVASGIDLTEVREVTPLGGNLVVFTYLEAGGGISREPWVLDTASGAVQLLSDIKQGGSSSNPYFLTEATPFGEIPIPVSTLFPLRVSFEDEHSSFDLDDYFTDPEGSPLSYTLTGLPADITVDAATQVVSTAANVEAGVHEVTVVASNPQGGTVASSFDWTVVDTGVLKISTTGDWGQATKGGPITSTAGSVITIGHKQGAERLFRVEDGSASIENGKLKLKGKIYPEITETPKPLMVGEFTVDMKTLAVSGFKDENKNDDLRFVSNLIEATFADIVIEPNRFNFRTDLTFDETVGGTGPSLVALGTSGAPLSLMVTQNGLDFGASAGTGRWLPEPVSFDIGGGSGLSIGFSNIGAEYEAASDTFYLSGKASFEWGGEIANQFSFIGSDREQGLTIDLAGAVQADNYFERGDKFLRIAPAAGGGWTWDVVGEIVYADKYEGLVPPNGLLVKQLKLEFDTIQNKLGGGFTANIPWILDGDISASVGAFTEPWRIDSFSFGIDGLNAPLGTSGIFVQGGSFGMEGLGNLDPMAEYTYKADITGTWGPNSSALPSPIHGKINGEIKGGEFSGGIELDSKVGYFVPAAVNAYANTLIDYFGVTPSAVTGFELFKLGATGKIDFSSDSIEVGGSISLLNGAISGSGLVKGYADYSRKGEMNLAASVSGQFKMPDDFPVIGGLGRSGNAILKYSVDDNAKNDLVAAWTQVTFSLGFTTKTYAFGAQYTFDGDYKMLGRKDIPTLSSWVLEDSSELVLMSVRWDVASDDVQIQVITPDGTVLSEADIAARDDIIVVSDLNSPTARHVAVQTPDTGIWDLQIVDPTGLGVITYEASEMLASAVAEFVSVTPNAATHSATIDLNAVAGDGEGDDTQVILFAAKEMGQLAGIELGEFSVFGAGQSLSHVLDYSLLGPGTWYLYTRAEADGLAPVVRMFDTPITITGAVDLGVIIQEISYSPTGTPILEIEVENKGDKPSEGGLLVLDFPDEMVGGAAVPEFDAETLPSEHLELALPTLHPGETFQLIYALSPGSQSLEEDIRVEAFAGVHDADLSNNEAIYVLHENGGADVDQYIEATDFEATVVGNSGDDTLIGTDANDLFFGGAGVDFVDGRDGRSDRMGFDFATGFAATQALNIDLTTGNVFNDGTGAAETITSVEDILGTRFGDLILGDNVANFLAGLGGNDTISGFGATDLIWGGSGLDLLDGGDGSDMLLFVTEGSRFVYDATPDLFPGITLGTHGVQVNLATGAVLDEFGFAETVAGFENISGSGYADSLTGDGVRNQISGEDGDDYINGAGANDRLEGGSGNDTVIGGDGFDHVAYYNAFAEVVINLAAGQATNDGDDGSDTLVDIEGVFGSDYSDVLIGDDLGNEFIGLGGDDTIDGAGGWDNVYYGNAPYWVIVDLASGQVSGGDGQDVLSSIEWVFGSDYSDDLFGDDLSNDLRGLSGNDLIGGRGGDDTLIGGVGDDTIDGGDGTDTAFYYGNQSSYTLTLSPTGSNLVDRRDGGDGSDELTNLEFLDFDVNLLGGQFDLTKFAGPAGLSEDELESFIELYIAYFNRAPDAIGLNFWGTAFANGLTLEEMAAEFGPQDETQAAYPPGTSNEVFATTVYNNVLGRTPDQAGIDFWVGQLDMGNVSRDQFILNVLQGAKSDLKPELGPDFVAQQLADQAYLENKIDIGAYFAVHKGMSDVDNASAAMALFDGSAGSITDAVSAIDGFFTDALDPTDGEFLTPLVGVLDDPFLV